MADSQAQLIFVAGPQAGQRVTVAGPVVLGRSAQCDVVIDEPYVSRRQVELAPTAEGVILQSLSDRGTKVGRKRYRPGKRVLLGSGDVVSLGAETQLLFVGPGEDAEALLADWRREHAPAEPAPEPVAIEAELADDAPVPARPAAQSAPLSPEQEKARRKRRLMIGLGIYFVVVMGAIVAAALLRDPARPQDDRPPARLTREAILERLQSVPGEHYPNPVTAQRALTDARDYFDRRKERPHYLFRAVQEYNRYKAFAGADALPSADDLVRYQTALRELHQRVADLYDQGYISAQTARWTPAQQAFRQVLTIVDDPQNPVHRNTLAHLSYVDRQLAQQQKTRSRYFR